MSDMPLKTWIHMICIASKEDMKGPFTVPTVYFTLQPSECLVKIGDQTVKLDRLFVDNLVLALILASMGLLDDNPSKGKLPVAAGQTYSISDAKEDIGYVSVVTSQEGMTLTISYWQERKRTTLDGPTIYIWLFCVIGMISLFCGAFLPDTGIIFLLRAACLFVFRSIWVTRLVFLLATAAHIVEAIYAWFLAKRVDHANAKGWFWQTFALGFFSWRLLLKRARK
ncbi:hypothetical protein VNO78_29121 [Psophocarpus tetragonolobus]|uniref:3-beta hydroxysteroid dehydrogenase/isomerase domain-containing protein n=1 Tax=Psophocarpus tetragonolobus TaxID=3891 RepID=A0AAN9X0H9_PSOTE